MATLTLIVISSFYIEEPIIESYSTLNQTLAFYVPKLFVDDFGNGDPHPLMVCVPIHEKAASFIKIRPF
jgi:hypothetical protein